jgi:glycosyltransferase involved in cell wall biosynthesis
MFSDALNYVAYSSIRSGDRPHVLSNYSSRKKKMIAMKKKVNSKPKKIVWARNMILDSDLFAKAEIEILEKLTQRGYEIFYISGHAKQKHEFNNSNVHLFSIPLGMNNFPLKYHLILAFTQFFIFPLYLLKVKPRLIIVDWDSIFSFIPMLPFYRLLGTKVVLDIRSTPTPLEDSQKKAGLRQYLLNLAFGVSINIAKKKLDGMTIITDLMKREICRSYDINPNRVGVWSSGVSSELFDYEKYVQDGIELRNRLGLANRFIICYHGAFAESRGSMAAISAMSMVKDQYPDAVLFMLGIGSIGTLRDMKNAIQHNGLQGRVILHDAVDHEEVPKYIAMCDVGIVPLLDLPQWRNQCPLKLLEYLAMKKTVILSDIPCHREVVGNDKCGIFLSSVSPSGIAESIAFAIDNTEKLEEWGAKGRAIVENKYIWQRIAENLDDYLLRLENKSMPG